MTALSFDINQKWVDSMVLSQLIDQHYDYTVDQLVTVYQKCHERITELENVIAWRCRIAKAFDALMAIHHDRYESLRRLFTFSHYQKTPSESDKSKYGQLFDFGEFEFQLSGNGNILRVYEKDLFSWTTLWPPETNGNSRPNLCQGCKEQQPNQLAHMDPGGCLARLPLPLKVTYEYLESTFLQRFKKYYKLDDDETMIFFQVLTNI